MVTNFGSSEMATKFDFVPDCLYKERIHAKFGALVIHDKKAHYIFILSSNFKNLEFWQFF